MDTEYLDSKKWRALAKNHRAEITSWTEPYRLRRRARQSHPVHDFLFIYYDYSTGKLEKWHPGVGFTLELGKSPDNPFQGEEYTIADGVVFCDPQKMIPKVQRRLQWINDLLKATQSRRPNFSCHGLHEWAMVYQGQDVRHESTTKLRLSQQQIDEVVESRPIACSHYDAFRFFADSASPLNKIQPTLQRRPNLEQPGCLHANMDLYKWAFRSMPWVGSELLGKCFHFAMEGRAIDMRASPYDLSDYGEYEPIPIETTEGRDLYEHLQRNLAEKARPLREELITKIETVVKCTQS